jgi:hypothetical protein
MSGLARFSVAALAIVGTTACAPDAWQNYKATGFNEYLSTVEQQCQPLWIGSMYLPKIDASYAGNSQSNFSTLLDEMSRFYYNRSTPGQFREAVQSIALSTNDPKTNASISCMIAKVPADRPSGPKGGF